MSVQDWSSLEKLVKGEDFGAKLKELYGDSAAENVGRYAHLLELYRENFGPAAPEGLAFFSAPGRTEIGGNHTDHQHGRVLAASVDMDTIAAAAPAEDGWVRVLSEGYPICEFELTDLSIHDEEKNSTAALIRGVLAGFEQRGCKVGAFKAAVTSSVLPGSGISSSAAFEILIGNIVNTFFHEGRADAVEIAQIGQYAENAYFGKPSGLMDQTASSVGNILTIDFEDPAHPVVRKLDVDFDACGYRLCIVDCGADHADLTDEYAAIPVEMKAVAAELGCSVLRETSKENVLAWLSKLREKLGDRAVLRALHFFGDNERVKEQAEALEKGDFARFLELVTESGRSSWMYLQNIVPCGANRHQEMAVALALCEELLGGEGAFRVHGGGFAGTVQAFVPEDKLEEFRSGMEKALGQGCCHVLRIRPVGGTCVYRS